MIARLVLRETARGKARFFAAVLGVAAAAGCMVFTSSLTLTNSAQGEKRAARLAAPWQAWNQEAPAGVRGRSPRLLEEPQDATELELASLAMDYRPDGRVLQGPPMLARLAHSAEGNVFANFALEGAMPDDAAAEPQVAVSAAMLRRGMPLPPIGSMLAFSTREGVIEAKVTGHLTLPGAVPRMLPFPNGYMNAALARQLPQGMLTRLALWQDASAAPANAETILSVAPMFATDAQRNFGRADLLLLWGAILVALALVVNTLSLSLDANRAELMKLRVAGMTRGGFLRFVCAEALAIAFAGWLLGTVAARLALSAFVAANASDFPEGVVFGRSAAWGTLAGAAAVAVAATILLSHRALRLKPLDAIQPQGGRKTRRRFGMAVSFGTAFAAFVAVLVWGRSLMKSFVPSAEWPDAIVSILPGVSSHDIAKISGIEGVAAIAEIQPFQVPLSPLAGGQPPPEGRGGRKGRPGGPEGRGRPPEGRGGPGGRRGWNFDNALLIGCDPTSVFAMAPFRFVAGNPEDAAEAMSNGACVITKMMADAKGLKLGDPLRIDTRAFDPRGLETELPVAGIVDLNWHMVTSRGKLRGLNGAPVMTDGPAFVAFDTIDSINPVPSAHVRMTHVWLNYEPAFLAAHDPLEAGQITEKRIKTALGAESCEVQLHARDEIADGTLAHGTDIIGSIAKIPYVFLVVLSIGFVAQLAGVLESRKREFLALRAAGATRGQLVWALAREAVWTALAGIVWGAAAGALAGWLATTGTRQAMAHWGIPAAFEFPAGEVVLGAAGAVAAALAVALPAAAVLIRRATRR